MNQFQKDRNLPNFQQSSLSTLSAHITFNIIPDVIRISPSGNQYFQETREPGSVGPGESGLG